MRDWIIPEFFMLTKDVELFALAAKLERFKMNEKSGAGWYINLRATTALDNMLISIQRLDGVRYKFKNEPTATKNTSQGESWVRKSNRNYNRYEWESTLFGYNVAYEHNGKTVAFAEKLSKCDRFTQHCILKGKPWTFEEYTEWKDKILDDRYWDEMWTREVRKAYPQY